ncbi:MAG: K+-sensing histidine kinase KdpD [Rickettsiales bacterium]|jgi:K+-sensing histidine kinase KdpD
MSVEYFTIALIVFFVIILMHFAQKRKIKLVKKKMSEDFDLHLKSASKSISHDLRNHISGILGLSGMIVQKSKSEINQKDAEEILELSNLIVKESEATLEFSNSLLSEDGLIFNRDASK